MTATGMTYAALVTPGIQENPIDGNDSEEDFKFEYEQSPS